MLMFWDIVSVPQEDMAAELCRSDQLPAVTPAFLILVLNSHSTFHNRYYYYFSFINEKNGGPKG